MRRWGIYAVGPILSAIIMLTVMALSAWGASDFMYGGINCGQASRSLSLVLRLTADGTESTSVLASQVTANYWRQGALRTSIATATLANAAVAYASGGFTEVDGTNMKGLYRLDLPDAAIACGSDWVSVNVTRVYGAASYVYHERLGLASAPDVNVLRWNQTAVIATTVDANVTKWGGTVLVATKVDANTTFWNGTAVIATTVDANVTKWNGTTTYATTVETNVTKWAGTLLAATKVDANTRFWNGTAVIATTVDVNVTFWKGTSIAATPVTANTTQIAGAAVSTTTAQVGVNVVQWNGTAVIATRVGANVQEWNNTGSATIATANIVNVWDVALAEHLSTGSTGFKLNAAASAGDPWSTALPGAYVDGTAGAILGRALATPVAANVTKWNGTLVTATRMAANVEAWNGTLVYATTVTANTTQWNGVAVIATVVDANTIRWNGTSVAATNVDANTVTIGGTTQTGRDLGASVLISPGTGTGQLGVSAGRITIQTYLQKNAAALKFPFIMTDSTTHAPKTGLTSAALGCVRSIDGGASATGTIANIAETDSGGYVLDFGAGDVNGNAIKLRCTANSADDTILTLYTYP